MRIPRFLKTITAGLVCIAFIRAVNGASDISIDDILLRIQTFQFDFNGINEIITFFTEKGYLDNIKPWDESLTGVNGVIQNIGNLLFNGVKIIVNTLVTFTKAAYNIIKEFIQLLGKLFNIITYICGFTS